MFEGSGGAREAALRGLRGLKRLVDGLEEEDDAGTGGDAGGPSQPARACPASSPATRGVGTDAALGSRIRFVAGQQPQTAMSERGQHCFDAASTHCSRDGSPLPHPREAPQLQHAVHACPSDLDSDSQEEGGGVEGVAQRKSLHHASRDISSVAAIRAVYVLGGLACRSCVVGEMDRERRGRGGY